MESLAATLIAVALFSFLAPLRWRQERRLLVLSALGLEEKSDDKRPLKSALVSSLRKRLAGLGDLIPFPDGTNLGELLDESGIAWTPQLLQGVRLGTGFSLAILVLPFGILALPLMPLAFVMGFRLPVLWLRRKRRQRWERVAGDLPEMVDLVAVLCYSGESLHRALRHTITVCGHLFTREEMGSVVERMQLGESTAEALGRIADHPCRELRRFGRTVLRAEESGAPIGDTLEELASELRSARREKNRVRASRVSVMILFPLVFLILPSFLLLTVGGMILGYTM